MELSPGAFRDLAKLIRDESGIALGPDKSYLVRHRLEPLARLEKLDSFETLVHRMGLTTGSRLRRALIDAITVKETQFFRDTAFFEALQTIVLPACAAAGRQRVRIWSAAASTGQEAYSLAILIREFLEKNIAIAMRESQFSILATDISDEAIAFAKAGAYTRAEVDRGVSESRLKTHFHYCGKRWCVEESLRKMIHFRTFNLLHPLTELGAFDLILCRNVLIYFDDATKRKVCRSLCSATQDMGWLALGSAESLYGTESRVETVMVGKMILYRSPAA